MSNMYVHVDFYAEVMVRVIWRLIFHYDNEYVNEILCADIIISCVLPGFIFVIVDDEKSDESFISLCTKTVRKRQRYFIVVLVLVFVVVVKS